MKQTLIIWLIVLFSALWGIEKLYDVFLQRNVDIKSSYILQEAINAELLILGSCEAYTLVNPEVLEKATAKTAYNLGTNHSGMADQLLHLHLYLSNNKAPEYLLLYLNPESFDQRFNKFNTYRFLHHSNDQLIREVILDQDPAYYWLFNIPFFKYLKNNRFHTYQALRGIQDWLLNSRHPFTNKGHLFVHNNLKQISHDLQKDHPKGITYQWDKEEEVYFTRLVSLARKHHIQLILFEGPIWDKAKEYINNINESHQRIHTLANKNTLKYIQFDRLNEYEGDTDFITCFRLNEKATLRFSEELGNWFIQKEKDQ